MGGWLRRQSGQALVLVALVLPVLFGIAALSVDASSLFVQKRATQNAADAAALAAADALGPASDAACQASPSCLATVKATAAAAAASYSDSNKGPSTLHECAGAADTDCYAWPYSGDYARIEVRLHQSPPSFFASALHLSNHTVSARAVARAKPTVITNPGTPLAIFAYTHDGTDPCGIPNGITIDGNPQTVIDAILSNGTVTMNTSGTVSWSGYGPPPLNCPRAGSHQANSATWAQQPSAIDWPRKFDRAAVCAGHDSNSLVNLNSPADGTYCSTVGINVTGLGAGNTYHVTLVAPVITVPNNNNHFVLAPNDAGLDAANKGLTLWQYGNGQDFSFDHNNSAINGVVWIQNGTFDYDGNSGVTGFYEAQSVHVTGNSYVMHGNGPAAGGSTQITGATSTLDE